MPIRFDLFCLVLRFDLDLVFFDFLLFFFLGTFPDLFVHDLDKTQLQGCAGLKNVIVERLLTFYDPRFAESSSFIFYMFSQKMRHTAAQQSTLKFRGRHHAETLTKLMQKDDFDDQLEYAIKHQKSKQAKLLNKKLLPLVHVSGSKIPWGPLERRHALTHLYAMTQTFGLGGFFITFSPFMMNNPLTIRMIRRKKKLKEMETTDHYFSWEDVPGMEDLAKRYQMVARIL